MSCRRSSSSCFARVSLPVFGRTRRRICTAQRSTRHPRVSNPLLSRLVTCQNITMSQFAEQVPRLSRGQIRTDVLDATGIAGAYDFTLSFSGPEVSRAQTTDPAGALILADALERQLGLRLEKRNIPMPVVVLEHVDATPSEN